MGFKCSVLGHRFEEPGLVNEREERGDEVIDVKRKVMVCSICGEQRVLAERKEITKQTCSGGRSDVGDEPQDDAVSGDTDDSVEEGDDVSPATDRTGSGASGFAGVDVVDSETTESTPGGQYEEDDSTVPSEANSHPYQQESEWTARSNPAFENAWHPATGENDAKQEEGATSETITAATDDGEIIASTATSEPDEAATETASGVTWNEPLATDSPQDQSDVPDEMLTCSTCEFSVIAADSPFRSGDICPRCHDTYLAETARERPNDGASSSRQSTE